MGGGGDPHRRAGVALGYYGDTAKTAKQVVTHPTTGETLFRTGDLGRLRPDGNLEILGREDTQVKVGGFRVELGEIEELLASDGAVDAAAATAAGGALAAYVVRTAGSSAEGEAALLGRLRALCAAQLPIVHGAAPPRNRRRCAALTQR